MKVLLFLFQLIIYPYNYFSFKKYHWKSCISLDMYSIKGKKYIEIGKNTRISKHVRIEAIDKYASSSYSPSITIGNNVLINQNFHCTCANSVRIGDGTSITANCGIFDIIHPYENTATNPRECNILTKSVKIGNDCVIGMNSVILPGTVLGNHCIVGANSTVSGIFPDYCVIAGSPARIIKYYNSEKGTWLKK